MLVVPGIVAEINASPARLVYVGNLTTQDGETLGMDGAAHVRALIERTGVRVPDAVVAHHGPLEVPPGLRAVGIDRDEAAAIGTRLEEADLADPGAPWPQHDPARLGAVLRRLA